MTKEGRKTKARISGCDRKNAILSGRMTETTKVMERKVETKVMRDDVKDTRKTKNKAVHSARLVIPSPLPDNQPLHIKT